METARTESSDSLKKATNLWVGIIVGLLGMQIVMCLVAAFFATSDPSWAIVNNYHDKALDWDKSQAAIRASQQLGWSSAILVSPTADVYGRRDIQVFLTDRDHAPISADSVELMMFHHARGGDVQTLSLTGKAETPGVYSAQARLRRPGLWEFRLRAKRGEETYVFEEQRDIPAYSLGMSP